MVPAADLRRQHGALFLVMLAVCWALPALHAWPWVWLVPLFGYAVVVVCVPSLRQRPAWLRPGRCPFPLLLATFGIMVLTTATLLSYQWLMTPDLSHHPAAAVFASFGHLVVAVIAFPIANAMLEEVVFRGVLFDAVRPQWGAWGALTITSILFGLGHLDGYPPGIIGAVLAGVFGLLMGVLRLWSEGLLLAIIAHIGADATIVLIVTTYRATGA